MRASLVAALTVLLLAPAFGLLGAPGVLGAGARAGPLGQSAYNVTFNQVGLPGGTFWYVNITNLSDKHQILHLSGTGPSLSGMEPNGNFSFTVETSDKSYTPNPSSGNFEVPGSDVSISVTFSPVLFLVTFSQSGLPSATRWWVNITSPLSQSFPGTGASISFREQDGTYSWTVATGNKVYGPQPATGSFVVNGGPASQQIQFGKVTYLVTFVESNLPAGWPWWVNITKPIVSQNMSTGSTITLSEPNGTYDFKIASGGKIYAPSPGSGRFQVLGASPAPISIVFSHEVYKLSFFESGLPAGKFWQVFVGTLGTNGSNAPWINFTAANATYAYSILPVPGWHANIPYNGTVVVAGHDVTVSLTWTRVTYSIVFDESGLAAGTLWSVSVGGISQNSTGSTIVFSNEPNNTYSYSIKHLANYTTNNYQGSAIVSGADVTIQVNWTLDTYTLTFAETGLPSGGGWNVTINGVVESSTLPEIFFTLPNGNYNFTVLSQVPGFVPVPPGGPVTISGYGVTKSIDFLPFAYAVSFQEQGLPPNTSWSVTVSGVRQSGNGTAIVFNLGNGSYTYAVGNPRGYVASPSSGSFTVAGQARNFSIGFQSLFYAVTFAPFGLPSTSNWSVTVHAFGQNVTEYAAGDKSLFFSEPNGTYAYQVGLFTVSWLAQPANGSVPVKGLPVQVNIAFVPAVTFSVTFTETGLLPGTFWSVAIGASILPSNTNSITTSLPVGNYSFYLGFVPGYRASVDSGVVPVLGAAVSVTVSFSLQATNVSTPPGQLPVLDLILIGLGSGAAVLGALAVALDRTYRKR